MARHVAHGVLASLAALLDRLDIQPRPREAVRPHAEDDHPCHLKPGAISVGPAPAPFSSEGVCLHCRGDELRLEIGTPENTADQLAWSWSRPWNARSGCAGCLLSYPH